MIKTKLVLLDLDGTLYDTRRVNYLSYNKALQKFGFNMNYDYFAKECNGRHYKVFLPTIMNGEERMEEVHNLKKRYYSEFLAETIENSELYELLDTLKEKYHVALATTASRQNTEEILRYHHREGFFEYMITQEDVSKKKPDPECYLKAMEHFKIDGKDTIIFEDSKVGIQAGEAAGATVFVVRGFA